MPLQPRKTKHPKGTILCWFSIIALAISFTAYFLLGEQAKTDVLIEKQRLLYLLIGVLIAGICFISLIASSWYKSN